MLSKVVMLMGITSLGISFYYGIKRKFFQDLFTNIDKCQKYQMDFIQDIVHLPNDRKMILVGPCILDNHQQPYIFRTFIQKKDQENRLWSIRAFDKQFYLINSQWQKIPVIPDKQTDIFAFNLQKAGLTEDGLQQRIIANGSRICCYGKLINDGGNKVLKAQMIMGGQYAPLLTYLDKQLVKLTSKQHRFIIAGTTLFGIHLLYTILRNREQKHSKILSEMQQS